MPGWYLIIQAVQATLVIASTVYAWRSAQQAAARSAVDQVRIKAEELEHRTLKIEEHIAHLPDDKSFRELQSNVARLVERTENLDGWLESTSRKLERIEDWIRENK